MKLNKFTFALAALGVISMAGVTLANTTVYLTGSTAARSIIDAAAQASGQIFTGAGTVVKGSASSGLVVYEGSISGVTGLVDLNCSWTGSEAGIAAVAGQNLTQNVNGGNYALPGVPPSFLDPTTTPAYSATNTLAVITGIPTATPDLSMADTSQAVSLTKVSTYQCTDYGIVGVVPFLVEKGYSSTPDSSWTDLVNVTIPQLAAVVSGPQPASYFTGSAGDTDQVAICGRNEGSGTRVNTLLNYGVSLTATLDQFAFDATYPAATPGVLTKGSNYGIGTALVETLNDGFDSGSGVQKCMNVDQHGSGYVLIGYVGVSDGQNAVNPAKAAVASQLATPLPFAGVYESDSGVENGSYTYWGSEHLLGHKTGSITPAAAAVAAAIKSGIMAQMTFANDGLATGSFATLPGTAATHTVPGTGALGQSVLIPTTLMNVTRGSLDYGYPTPGSF